MSTATILTLPKQIQAKGAKNGIHAKAGMVFVEITWAAVASALLPILVLHLKEEGGFSTIHGPEG